MKLPSSARMLRACQVHEKAGMRGDYLSKAAGWMAVAFGAVHVVVAPLDTRKTWSQVLAEGWWNTFTLNKATTITELERSETFWITLGSFGAPVLVLGCYIVWSTRKRQRVPGWLGWIILAWGLPFVTTLPASPGWVIPVIGALLVLGDGLRSRHVSPRVDARSGMTVRHESLPDGVGS